MEYGGLRKYVEVRKKKTPAKGAYRNKFETAIAKLLKKYKARFDYECEKIPYIIASHYLTDFRIHTPNGLVYIETKGYLRPEDKRKMVALKRQHPEKDIRIVFQKINPKYVRWADRNGFKWAENTVPREWLL